MNFPTLTLATLALVFVALDAARAESPCPITADGETALDCPWAGIVRELNSVVAAHGDVNAKIRAIAPEFVAKLEKDAAAHSGPRSYKSLWGTSLNYDENVQATIIANPLIDWVLETAKVTARDGKRVHAGFEHTYGYLFSNLKTPYGFKRLRWVRPDIEQGLGLAKGAISPLPSDGGLFSNVTYLAGRIAFRQDPQALAIVMKGKNVSPRLKSFSFASLKPTRLQETIRLEGGRTVVLRTDFVPFTQGEFGGNGELLVYSVKDSEQTLPQLITVFPVAKNFRDGALKPANLGEGKPIITRYNAFVSGVTDSSTPFTGKREIVSP